MSFVAHFYPDDNDLYKFFLSQGPDTGNGNILDKEESDTLTGDVKRSDEVMTLQVTPQMVLVCCWRSMKEVSLLLGQLALDVPVCEVDDEATGGNVSPGLLTAGQVNVHFLSYSCIYSTNSE